MPKSERPPATTETNESRAYAALMAAEDAERTLMRQMDQLLSSAEDRAAMEHRISIELVPQINKARAATDAALKAWLKLLGVTFKGIREPKQKPPTP